MCVCDTDTDEDECQQRPGVCGQASCVNSVGSYQCRCSPGTTFDQSAMACVGQYPAGRRNAVYLLSVILLGALWSAVFYCQSCAIFVDYCSKHLLPLSATCTLDVARSRISQPEIVSADVKRA